MKQMLKIELERAFKSAGLKVSLLIGIVISALHFFQKVLPTALDPLHFYKTGNLETVANVNNMWMAMGEGWHYTLYVRLIPLLAVVPYAVTYYTDYKKGIVKNYYTRTKKINYISAKYIAVFVTGGVAVVMPLLINYLTAITILPSLVWPVGVFASSPKSIWSAIFYTHPHIYMIMYMILLFVCGGLMATIALIVSNIVNNRFVAMLAPYIITEFANAILRMSDKKWLRGIAPTKLFNMAQTNTGASFIVYIAVLLILGVVVYFIGGLKHETY